MSVSVQIYRVQLLSQFPIPRPRKYVLNFGRRNLLLPQDMSGHLGLPLPCEDPLLVSRHPPRLLLGHEVCKIPNMLACRKKMWSGEPRLFKKCNL